MKDLYNFLLQLGFWQWIGVLSLASIACTCVVGGLGALAKAFNKK